MLRGPWFAIFFRLGALAFSAAASAAEVPPYPVWWSPLLELDSLEGVEVRLHRDLWPHDPEGLDLYIDGSPDHRKMHARDCNSLIGLSEAGYQGLGNPNIKVQLLNLAHCRAIAMLGRARPAQESHLRDFVLNREALEYLPALVNLYPSCEFICYAVAANERAIPFTEFERILVVDVTSEDEITVWTTRWMVRLTIMGRGDFTADGVDDILLLANGGATEGTYGTTRLYLLTRDNSGAVLRAIDAEDELCLDYDCHPLPRDTAAYRESSIVPSPEDIGVPAVPSEPGGATPEDSPPYPVWWSPGFGLKNLDQIEEWLRRDFRPGLDLGIRLFKGPIDDYVEAEAKNCLELEALTQAGYGVRPGRLHISQRFYLLRCRTIARLKTLRPASRSFLREFVFSEANVRDLLEAFGLLRRGGAAGGAEPQDEELILTSGLGKLLALDTPYSGEVGAWAENGRVQIRIEARGDFTGDGIEDLLLTAGMAMSRYRPDVTDLCIITREAPKAALRLTEVGPYSCQKLGAYGKPADDDD